MAKRGRPPKLNDIKKREICALVSAGVNQAVAVEHVGCSRQTLFNTLRRDRKFREDIERSELAYYVRHLRNIDRHAEKSWRASAWALARRYPGRYADRPDIVTAEELQLAIEVVGDLAFQYVPEENSQRYQDALQRSLSTWKERRRKIKKEMSTPKGRRIAAELRKAGPLTQTPSEDEDHNCEQEHNQHRNGRA